MYKVQAYFRNNFCDILTRQIKIFNTLEEVKSYINEVDTHKYGIIKFKMQSNDDPVFRSYIYVKKFDKIIKGDHFGVVYNKDTKTPDILYRSVFTLWQHPEYIVDRIYQNLKKDNRKIYNYFISFRHCTSENEAIKKAQLLI